MVGPHTPGAWRAEITGGQGRTRTFLTLLVPADVDAPSEPQATLKESSAGWEVSQGDLTVALLRPSPSPSSPPSRRPIARHTLRTIQIDLA
jgi:hypothetical protein